MADGVRPFSAFPDDEYRYSPGYWACVPESEAREFCALLFGNPNLLVGDDCFDFAREVERLQIR